MTRGSGFALGPGYRKHFGNVLVDVSAGISLKTYKAADVKVRWLQAFDRRFEIWTNYRYEDFPQEDFFGMGLDSSLDTRTSYDFENNEVSLHGILKPLPWLETGAVLGYNGPDVETGSDSNYPSIEAIFADAQAPGLDAQPNFLHTTFFANIDFRDERGLPRSGGFYHAAFGIWDDRTLQRYDFRRFDATLAQWIPLVRDKTHVLSGRVGLSYVNNEAGERVPFYYLAYVGGVDTIRSFREFRFKDENAIWMSAEYTWSPLKYVSLAAFVDAGEVQPDWQDINFGGLKTGYGFGIRAHSDKQMFARLDFGTGGGEGWQVFVKLGPAF
jgi:outer membrane protein assembly factor BamA